MNRNSKINKHNQLVIALHRILAGDPEIIAIDYPSRPYKKAVDTILRILKENDIIGEKTIAEWPHFTLAYVSTLTRDQKEKIKLAAPAYLSRIATDKLITLEGKKFSKIYISWELKIEKTDAIKKLINWISEETETKQQFEFKPHVSLVVADLKYKDKVNEMLPKMYEEIKQYKTTYLPDQIQFWKDMEIYDIENAKYG